MGLECVFFQTRDSVVRAFWRVIIIAVALEAGCASRHSTECTNLEDSTRFLEVYLERFAVEIESTHSTDEAFARILSINSQYESQVETCAQIISRAIQDMPPDQVMRHHEAFIHDPRVSRFLDAQDSFNASADPDKVERLDEMLTPLFLLSE